MMKLFCSYSPVCLNPHCSLHYSLLTGFANNSFSVELPKNTLRRPNCCSSISSIWLIRILVSEMKRSVRFQKRTQTAEILSEWLCGYPILRACMHVFFRSSPVAEFSYTLYPSKSVVSVKVRWLCKTLWSPEQLTLMFKFSWVVRFAEFTVCTPVRDCNLVYLVYSIISHNQFLY